MTTAIIGDVHGALQPLEALIARLGLDEGDRLVLLGDLVDKGPDPADTVKFVRQLSETAPFDLVLVEGNHEDRHRRYHQNLTERPKIARQMAEAAPEDAATERAVIMECLSRADRRAAEEQTLSRPVETKTPPETLAETPHLRLRRDGARLIIDGPGADADLLFGEGLRVEAIFCALGILALLQLLHIRGVAG